MNFRKKPVVIQAMPLEWGTWNAMCAFADVGKLADGKPEGCYVSQEGQPTDKLTDEIGLMIPTLEGIHLARQGDYVIRGVKGELYPCKPDIFAMTYESVDVYSSSAGLDFGGALQALKAGHRIARDGWYGKGMWLALSGPLGGKRIPAESFWSKRNAEYAAQTIDGSANVLPCITMKTAAGDIQMGWLASQADLLAEDWFVIEGA